MAEHASRPWRRRLAAALTFLAGALLAGTIVAFAGTLTGEVARAKEAQPAADDPALEAHMLEIAQGLRCLVCQNQTIADSHADLAADLRQEIRELLQQGKTDEEIRRYMTDRYGDFVLYRPPFQTNTVLLWLGPGLLLASGSLALYAILKRRARLPDRAFDPDADTDTGPPADPGLAREAHEAVPSSTTP